MTAPALVATGLGKRFTGRDGDVTALKDVDLELWPGRILAIAGASASGRTTLLRCLSGTYRPDAGAVVLHGPSGHLDLATADSRAVAWARAWGLSIFDGPLAAPPRRLTADAVSRAARCEPVTARAALARLGASGLAGVPVGRLRRPEAATAALAAALASTAPVILLDDPGVAADDVAVAAWLRERAAAGVAVLATTHVGGAVVSAADEVLSIERGVLRCLTS